MFDSYSTLLPTEADTTPQGQNDQADQGYLASHPASEHIEDDGASYHSMEEVQEDQVAIELDEGAPHQQVPYIRQPVDDIEWEASVLLTLREKYYCPFGALEFVSTSMREYHEKKKKQLKVIFFSLSIKSKFLTVSFIFFKEQLAAIVPDEVRHRADYQSLFSHPDDVNLSRYRMETSWKKSFPAAMPKEIVLTPADKPIYEWVESALASGELEIDQVFETGYYVPFLQSLEHYLNVKDVYIEVKKSFRRNTTAPTSEYKDVWDGTSVKMNPIFIRFNGAVIG